MRFNPTALCALTILLTSIGEICRASDHRTVRFVYSSGYPHNLLAMAFSPSGEELAVSTGEGQVSFVRTGDGETTARFRMSPFSMSYSRDGSRLFMISRYQSHLLDVDLGRPIPYVGETEYGFLGMRLDKRNGKLLVIQILAGSPVENHGMIEVGDEIVAVGQSKGGSWDSLIGEGVDGATKLLRGPVGTHVRLRVVPKGEVGPTEYTLTRESARVLDGTLKFRQRQEGGSRENVVWCMQDGRHRFYDAHSGKLVSSIESETIRNVGRYAISPDGSKFAIISTFRDGDGLAIEIYDMPTQQRINLFEFPKESAHGMVFSADGSKLLIGTHYTTEVLDLEQERFLDPIILGLPPAPKVERLVAGYGGSAVQETIQASRDLVGMPSLYQSPKFVECLDASSSGHVAVGNRGGVRLFRIADGAELATFTALSDKKIEAVKFSPDGRTLAYFCHGALHLVDVSRLGEDLEIVSK